ncbi:fumarylacetoacetate hydrolase family protein [Amycolatopsis palatopharyngis]|uniref:fumarylacetoacetate hydrolase family protein n=1 Tax=Amycolatopsis palatopharyngis TaxID=187982 RepID=UPI000E25030C|nr:fumarylacetoacetate hydrolase family protein [Amycolatopsis palatopharyngis]
MRFANVAGRLTLLTGPTTGVDIHSASGGRFPADPAGVYEQWAGLLDWVRELDLATAETVPVTEQQLGNPAPRPQQVFAIGLNYADHAAEAKFAVPETPTVFTKFPSCLTGPFGQVTLPDGDVDWEVELVAVIGRRAEAVQEEHAWEYVAGLSVGQDISERRLQLAGPVPQFSLGKSYPGFGPIGPVLVTPDEVADREDLEIGALLNGEQIQKGRTSDLVFSVAALVAQLSAVTPLLPGDVIFTGTPAGVGLGRKPPRFLKPGDELVSYIQGIGEMRHVMAAPSVE